MPENDICDISGLSRGHSHSHSQSYRYFYLCIHMTYLNAACEICKCHLPHPLHLPLSWYKKQREETESETKTPQIRNFNRTHMVQWTWPCAGHLKYLRCNSVSSATYLKVPLKSWRCSKWALIEYISSATFHWTVHALQAWLKLLFIMCDF